MPAVQFYHPAQNSAIKFYVFTLSGQHRLTLTKKRSGIPFHAAAFSIQEILINKKSAAE